MKFKLYPNDEKAAHDAYIKSKIDKSQLQMFFQAFDQFNRLDTNKIRFWKTNRINNNLLLIF